MTAPDPYLVVRAAALYLAVAIVAGIWLWRPPGRRRAGAAVVATAWTLPSLLAVHLVAGRAGWWTFDATGGTLLELPVDLYLAWALLWGAAPALAMTRLPLPVVAGAALALDLLAMPMAAPVVVLGDRWLTGEAVALAVVLVPAQLLARWTADDRRLAGRALLQVMAFAGLLLLVAPAVAFDAAGAAASLPPQRPAWLLSAAVQMVAIAALPGLTAVQEFVTRGRGTPVPLDPPRALVTTGIYAYLRNPMQTSGAMLVGVMGLLLGDAWLAGGAVIAVAFSIGLAGWSEDADLQARFGARWERYRADVPRWLPRWRPWHSADVPPARLYVADGCGVCRGVGAWLLRRGPTGLQIVHAECHPSQALSRVAYEAGDGYRATGVAAVARALEHVHVLWAFVGFALRLPGVTPIVQVLVDASGGHARSLGSARPPISRLSA